MNYSFNELTKRLQKINFDTAQPMLKFTFDVNKAVKEISHNHDFSTQAEFQSKNLIMQKDLYESLKSVTNVHVLIDKAYKHGLCTPTAIYNAFPELFDEDINQYSKQILKCIDNKESYAKIDTFVQYLNSIKQDKLLYCSKDLQESYTIFTQNIDKGMPIVLAYKYQNLLGFPVKVWHTIAFFGYDQDFLYYHENSDDNILFISLSHYLRSYYQLHKDLLPKDELFQSLVNTTNINKFYDYSSRILGYNYFEQSKLSTIRKSFLTDTKIFYDANRLVQCKEQSNYCNNLKNLSGNFNIDFNELFKQKINQ